MQGTAGRARGKKRGKKNTVPPAAPVANAVRTSERAMADTVEKLLEAIGYPQYLKALEDGGCETMAQLQFVTLEVLLKCGVKPVHAAHLFALMKDTLGMPATSTGATQSEIEPLRVYICPDAPPTINGIDQHAMMADIEFRFDAVWEDPRLSQPDEVVEGDPVDAPYSWHPTFGCAGTNKMEFKAVRAVYLAPQTGLLRTTFRATGQCPLASADDEGHVAIKLKLYLTRFTDNWVELWHPRHAVGRLNGGRILHGGWERLTDNGEWTEVPPNHKFLLPTDYTEEFILPPEYRLSNRHAHKEKDQDDWLKVDRYVGFQVLASTYTKEIMEDLKQTMEELEIIHTGDSLPFSLSSFSLKLTGKRPDELRKIMAKELWFLDEKSDEKKSEIAQKFVMRHYFGKKQKLTGADAKKSCAHEMAEQLIDLQREVENGNADAEEWNECPVDPELAKMRQAEEGEKLKRLETLGHLKDEARRWGIDDARIEEADDSDGRAAELIRLILKAKGVIGNRRRSAMHGWVQTQADNTSDSPNFSVFQLTIRLHRLEEFYYLNPSLKNQPQAIANETNDQDTQLHVWVQNTIHTLKDIDAASSSVSIKMHTTAYWRDRRLRTALMHRRILSPEYVWYPPLDVTSKETFEVKLLRMELINADTGLVRADYAMSGKIHNHMALREFPLDADTIAVELFCQRGGYHDVCLHTGGTIYTPPTTPEAAQEFKDDFNWKGSIDEALASDRCNVMDALSAMKLLRARRGSSRVLLTDILKSASGDDRRSYGPGSQCTVLSELGGEMCVFHHRGLPEVVGRYAIFTLDELDYLYMREELELQEQEQEQDKPNDGSTSHSNPILEHAPDPQDTSIAANDFAYLDIFKEKAEMLTVRELQVLMQSHGMRRTRWRIEVLNSVCRRKRLKRQLVHQLTQVFLQDQQLDADEGVTHTNDGYPTSLRDVTLLQDAKIQHEWAVVDTCAEETSGLKVIVKLRVHRQAGFYFWKILFILLLLVYATLASFFFPGDGEGMAIRVSISSTMFLALCGLLNVAQETLPKLEYLTDCDKLIMLSTVIVFLVNVWNCILLLMWNATGTHPSDGDEPGYFENVAYHGSPNSPAVVYALPFQQTCPKIDTLRLPDAGFWASFWRFVFRLLSVDILPDEQQTDDPFEPPEESDNCLAARLDHQFAWLLIEIYHVAMCLLFLPTWWARFKEQASVSPERNWRRIFFFLSPDSLKITLRDAKHLEKNIRDHLEAAELAKQQDPRWQHHRNRLANIHASTREMQRQSTARVWNPLHS